MIYLDVNPTRWKEKYGVEPCEDVCRKCGCKVVVDIPIISKDFVGYESEAHECGNGYKIIMLKPRDVEVQSLFTEE
jgi:hypothetical protein